jgi:rhodanese-related sulfurtransferase
MVLVPGLLAVSCVQPAPPEAPQPPAAVAAKPAPAAVPKPPVKPGPVTRISITDFFPLQQSGAALVYDVRPAIFHNLGHIPGSVSWPKGKFASGLASHEPEIRAAVKAGRPIILYCTDRECPDSGSVATRLAALGYPVTILEGGYEEWKLAEMPTE